MPKSALAMKSEGAILRQHLSLSESCSKENALPDVDSVEVG